MENRGDQLLGSLAILAFLIVVGYFGATTTAGLSKRGELQPLPTQSTLTFNPGLIVSTTSLAFPLPHLEATTTTIGGIKATTVVVVPAPPILTPVPVRTATTTPKGASPSPPVTATAAPIVEEFPDAATFKAALVNIFCTSRNARVRGETGSGILIDSRGIILTAAHVAQAQLLSETLGENIISCTIRTGDPARSAYKAKLVYISQRWLEKNPTTLISSQPMGTGEDDIALLAITERVNGSTLPSSFVYVPLSSANAGMGESVYVGGYGAQYLSSSQVRTSLSPTFVKGTVDGLYTLHGASLDVVSILAGRVAQLGSSGGGAINTGGELLGVISTSEISGDFSTRHVRVITPRHIRESFRRDTGENLADYLGSASLSVLVSSYASKSAELGAFLAHSIGLQ